MKKFIRTFSVLSLVFVFAVASASASAVANFGTEVEIPFSFNVGEKAYAAGSYIVTIERVTHETSALRIRDTKNETSQTILLNLSYAGARDEIKLVFDTVGGKKYLTKVGTADRFAVVDHPKADRKTADAEKVRIQPAV